MHRACTKLYTRTRARSEEPLYAKAVSHPSSRARPPAFAYVHVRADAYILPSVAEENFIKILEFLSFTTLPLCRNLHFSRNLRHISDIDLRRISRRSGINFYEITRALRTKGVKAPTYLIRSLETELNRLNKARRSALLAFIWSPLAIHKF